MTMRIYTLFVIAVATGLASPAKAQDAMEQECCGCAPDGEEHHFPGGGWCDWACNPITAEPCKYCNDSVHYGCHANALAGECTLHGKCERPGDEEAVDRAFIQALVANREAEALTLAAEGAWRERVHVNGARHALQMLDCADRIVGHIEVGPGTLERLQRALQRR
jgi:hypothetical protein